MAEMTLKELKKTIKYYCDNGEIKTAKRLAMNYKDMKGFNFEKTLGKIMLKEKKTQITKIRR